MANQPTGWVFSPVYWSQISANYHPMFFDSPQIPLNGLDSSAYNCTIKLQQQCVDGKRQRPKVQEDHISNSVNGDDGSEVKVEETGTLKIGNDSIKEEYSSLPNMSKLNMQVPSPQASGKHLKCQHYRQSLLGKGYETLIEAMEAPANLELPFPDVLKFHIQQLKHILLQDACEAIYAKKIEAAKKNATLRYVQILRFALKLMAVEAPQESFCITQVREILTKNLPTIQTVIGIYRSPELAPFVAFLKLRILTEEKLPQLVMAMNIRPAEKLAMMMLMPGFLYALHHPHEHYRYWDLDAHRATGNTLQIIQAINQRGAGYAEIMRMLEETYNCLKVGSKTELKYNNVSGRYRTILQRALTEFCRQGKIDKTQAFELEKILKSGGNSFPSKSLRELLCSEKLRSHLQSDWIDNSRLMLQILGDGSLKCHIKLTMMKCYPLLVRAIAQPEKFSTWKPKPR